MDEVFVDLPLARIFERLDIDISHWLASNMVFRGGWGSWTTREGPLLDRGRLTAEATDQDRLDAWRRRLEGLEVETFPQGLHLGTESLPLTDKVYCHTTDIGTVTQDARTLQEPFVFLQDQVLPESMLSTMAGRPVCDVVAHAILEDLTIDHAVVLDYRGHGGGVVTRLHIRPRRVSIRTTLAREPCGDY